MTGRCLRCGVLATLRNNGTIGRHWSNDGKVSARIRCPEGEPDTPRPPRPTGRRITVRLEVEAVLPVNVHPAEWKAGLRRLIHEHATANLVVAAHVEIAPAGGAR